MPVEIERKFLVNKLKWESAEKGIPQLYQQGYLLTDPDKTIRIRTTDERGYITIKGKTTGASRPEYEYAIPKEEAVELLDKFCTSVISKYRYKIVVGEKLWEVDQFLKANEGLILAEIELADEKEEFELPEWIEDEVTTDERYYNASLSQFPFKQWPGNKTV